MLNLQRIDHTWDGNHIDTMWLLGSFFNQELGELVKFDAGKAINLIKAAAEKDSDFFLITLNTEETIVGLLGGCVTTPPFSGTKIATEIIWYVRPEYRGSIKSLRMIKEFETWAKEQGAEHVAMVAQENSGSDPARVYERLGYKLAERTFTKRL